MNAVDRMLIEHICQTKIIEYSVLNDEGKWDEVAAMFTEDAAFARPSAPDDVIKGRQAILETFKSRKPSVTHHIVSNVIVRVESPTNATATSSLQLFVGKKEGDAQVASHAMAAPFLGGFTDRLQLVDGDWLFAERLGYLTIK